jgi:hypothetical protein
VVRAVSDLHIHETHERECMVCEMIERGVKSAGAFYFAGLLHALNLGRVEVRLCPPHFAAWNRVATAWQQELPQLKETAS